MTRGSRAHTPCSAEALTEPAPTPALCLCAPCSHSHRPPPTRGCQATSSRPPSAAAPCPLPRLEEPAGPCPWPLSALAVCLAFTLPGLPRAGLCWPLRARGPARPEWGPAQLCGSGQAAYFPELTVQRAAPPRQGPRSSPGRRRLAWQPHHTGVCQRAVGTGRGQGRAPGLWALGCRLSPGRAGGGALPAGLGLESSWDATTRVVDLGDGRVRRKGLAWAAAGCPLGARPAPHRLREHQRKPGLPGHRGPGALAEAGGGPLGAATCPSRAPSPQSGQPGPARCLHSARNQSHPSRRGLPGALSPSPGGS